MAELAFPKPPKRIRDPRFLTAYKRAHPLCEACARRRSEETHHLQSRKMSGGDIESNVVALCKKCHSEWTGVNRTRRAWYAQYAATMSAETRAKVRAALKLG